MRHALHSLPPPERREAGRSRPNRRPRRRGYPTSHQATVVETATKLSVNVIVILMASVALVKLIPYNVSQQTKLQKLTEEVEVLETRVNTLQHDFKRYFDPQQAKSVMQEESNRVNLGQMRVVWTESPETPTNIQSEHTSQGAISAPEPLSPAETVVPQTPDVDLGFVSP